MKLTDLKNTKSKVNYSFTEWVYQQIRHCKRKLRKHIRLLANEPIQAEAQRVKSKRKQNRKQILKKRPSQ